MHACMQGFSYLHLRMYFDLYVRMYVCTYLGTASVMNTMATVTIDGLACGVTYTIITGGTLDGDLVGPRSSHETTTGPCPPMIITTTATITSMTSEEL